MKKMNVAIIGQGRSGRNIHGKFFKSEANDFCKVVCVVEADEFRREKAAKEYGCDVVADYRELFEREDIDVVVNASFSQMHAPITKDLLEHGFNVLSEKPFGRTAYECRELIRIAKSRGLVLAVFHQSLLSPAFLNVKNIIESGKLGRVFQINLKYSGFARRWDWQTLQSKCAGGLYNTGPHPIGQGLDLIGWDDNAKIAYSYLTRALTSGDGDDCGKIIITAPDKPTLDIEVISADAYSSDYVFKIYGTKGTLVSTNSSYKMKYIPDLSACPERPVVKGFLSDSEGAPVYCSEKLDIAEEAGDVKGTSFDSAVSDFYKMLYGSVMLGEALKITPEQAARVIEIIEECHARNPLSVDFD